MVLAYLMIWHGVSLRAALLHVRGIRPVANPNPHFISHLKGFEEELLARKGGEWKSKQALELIVQAAKLRVVKVPPKAVNLPVTADAKVSEYVAYRGTETDEKKLFTLPAILKGWLVVLLLAVAVALGVSAAHRCAIFTFPGVLEQISRFLPK